MTRILRHALAVLIGGVSFLSPAKAGPPLLQLRPHTLEYPGGYSFASREAFQEKEIYVFEAPLFWSLLIQSRPNLPYAQELERQGVPFSALGAEEQDRLRRLRPLSQLNRLLYFVVDPQDSQQKLMLTPEVRAMLNQVVDGRDTKAIVLPPRKIYATFQELEAELKQHGATAAQVQKVRSQTVQHDGHFALPLTRAVGDAMPASMQEQIRASPIWDVEKARSTYIATFSVSESTIPEIVRAYGRRDPADLERRLRAKLAASGQSVVSMPATEVMEAFIRHNLGRFETYSGANCLNAALCRGSAEFLSAEQFIEAIGKDYAPVGARTPVEVGDVVVYWERSRNGNLKLLHAVRYLGEGVDPADGQKRAILFTKNGAAPDQPYVFSDRVTVEEAYSRLARSEPGNLPGLVTSVHRERLPHEAPTPGPQMVIYRDTTVPAFECVKSYSVIGVHLRGRATP